MNRKQQLAYIAKHQSEYLETSGKSLDERIKEITLSKKEEATIKKEQGTAILREKGFSLFGVVGDIANSILDWNTEVNDNISEAKKMILIEEYFNKSDEFEHALEKLSAFIRDPQGNTLFNKLIRIVDDSPPDLELVKHLSKVLENICKNGNFKSLFEQHRYALGQIERLTPQALTIIADQRSWPLITLGFTATNGTKVTSDFYTEFTAEYCKHKRISDKKKTARIQHSIIELQNLGLMEAHKTESGKVQCALTQVGEDIKIYLE
ncbi:hypothetical protein [Shouchella shacheensis]|uniref:hypothetical protein n=1 Tax=Shouchella shacheensis TaxID=1649580 RepID=UPI00073FFA30|nr:hypothetical protein [Shouchella shacheensis]